MKKWIDEAVESDAKILIGGNKKGPFIEPTVITDVKHDMKVVCEEIFGPVITLIPYNDLDEAIKQANDSDYGLQSGIYTESIQTAKYAAEKLKTGGVIINDASTYRADLMPYGGIKDSGIGREGPAFTVKEMTEIKTIVFDF